VVRIRREQRVGIRALVPLEVGGSTIWPVLDTGASGTHLRAERLGLVPARVREGVTVRGTGEDGQAVRTVAYYELEDVALGGIDAGPVVATGRDRGPGAGLLGLNVLGRYLAVYDFRAGEALFERVESSPLPTWTEWSRMREGPVRLAAPPVR
jgi:predicted aspartyl protease